MPTLNCDYYEDNIDTCMQLHELEMETFFFEVFNLAKFHNRDDDSADPTSHMKLKTLTLCF